MIRIRWPRPSDVPRFRIPLAILGGLAAAGLGVLIWLASLPLPEIGPAAQSSQILAADGQTIGSFHGEENRTVVGLDDVSHEVKLAVVAIEDRTFFDHRGFSLRGVIRAARANWQDGEIVQGGSTITQQYVRQAFPRVGTERSLARKIKEAFWAVKLERSSSKEEILQNYLNTVYFGRGAYGVEAAARTYFKVSATELTPGQAAYLAGVVRAPQRYQIDRDPVRAVNLRNGIIDQLTGMGLFTAEVAEGARQEDLVAQFKPGMSIEIDSARAGYFVEYVRRVLKSEFQLSDEEILRGGLQIHTTLDPRMQDAAEEAVRKVLDQPTDPEVGLVAMDPQGHVRAMVGGRDVDSIDRARGFNFAANLPGTNGGRPAGSAFKTLALAAFLEEGKSVRSTFSGASTLSINSDRCRNGAEPWKVSNYGNSGYGYLDIVEATTRSVNTIYAQMMDDVVAPEKFMEVAAKTGIEIPPHDTGCALALGTSDVTPLDMAEAYTTFAQRGQHPTPLVITRIVRPDGQIMAERQPALLQTIDANVADTVNYILERNIQSGTGTGAKIGRPAAGKTGTTDNFQDAWFAGYTPDLTAVVWVGFAPEPDGKIPLMNRVRGRSVTGGSFPATIWKHFMTAALEGTPKSEFNEPELGGEIINNRPPPPAPVYELEWPVIEFPPCFPFCSAGPVNPRPQQPSLVDRLRERQEERRRDRQFGRDIND